MMTTTTMITVIMYVCHFRQKSQRKSLVFYSISLIVLHVLDALLLMILLPFMIWQWISANDRLKIILKAVVEVHFHWNKYFILYIQIVHRLYNWKGNNLPGFLKINDKLMKFYKESNKQPFLKCLIGYKNIYLILQPKKE